MESTSKFAYETARLGEFRRRIVRHVQCRSCGYEPRQGLAPAHCPKCGGGCWEKFAQIGKLRPDPPAVRTARLRRAAPAPAGAVSGPPTPPDA